MEKFKQIMQKIQQAVKSNRKCQIGLGITGGLLLVLLALYPLIVGIVAEKKVDEFYADLKERMKDKAEVTLDYKRSYFSSKLNLEVKNFKEDAGAGIRLNADVRHLSLNMQGHLEANENFHQTFLTQLQNLPLIKLSACLGITGRLRAELQVDTFTVATGSDEHSNTWKLLPISAKIVLNRKSEFQKVNLYFGGLDLKAGKESYLIQDIAFDWQVDDGIRIYDTELVSTLKNFESDEFKAGPVVLSSSVKNLDTNALKDMKGMAMGLNKLTAGMAGQDPQMVQQRLLGQLTQLLTRLVQHSPRLEIKFNEFKTSYGDINLDSYLALSDANLSMGILSVLTSLQAEINLKVPQAAADYFIGQYVYWKSLKDATDELYRKHNIDPKAIGEKMLKEAEQGLPDTKLPTLSDAEVDQVREKSKGKIKETMEDLANKKLIVKESNGISAHFQLQKGAMTLNGNPFNLSQLK